MHRQKFHRRRRRKPDVYHVYAREAANAGNELHDGLARGAAIAANHNTLGFCNLEKRAHMALQHLRCKRIANDTADTGNGTHQFGHLIYSVLSELRNARIEYERFLALVN